MDGRKDNCHERPLLQMMTMTVRANEIQDLFIAIANTRWQMSSSAQRRFSSFFAYFAKCRHL